MQTFDLTQYGISGLQILRNLSPAVLYEEAIRFDHKTSISATGALVAYSGEKTGRSPRDKRVVKQPPSQEDVWWGSVNFPQEPLSFQINRERAIDYLQTRDRLYVVDGFAGWDPATRLKIRVICSRPYHALFMRNMLIRPTHEELESFGEPDYVIFNAGAFPANRLTQGMTSTTSVDLNFEAHEMVILGTEYAGEMKKGVFTIMNYLMPKRGLLPMHCSATRAKQASETALFFGLSGTGKTTLSADPQRLLIGDDEHVWSDTGVFNIEGGCYAKAIDLTPESEPDIFQALQFGAVLENVVLDAEERMVDFKDARITQNTRGAYPIEFIKTSQVPCLGGHPTQVIFLTCDAFGVLPPVAKLTREQAMYYFLSGYTAKVAGTEVGVTEPQVTFSACFGAPFLVWHPTVYARLLAEKLECHHAQVWLVNTGWSGGGYGVGSRIKLGYTRAIVNAINSGELKSAPVQYDDFFGLAQVTKCPGVPDEILQPAKAWSDEKAYRETATKLAGLFRKNFEKFADQAGPEVTKAGPKA
ncbi:MAG TPA: phosphoenolpyruvate carboxykinase (ATP) [Chthoniobacterales bacterium]|nr:phosphoenolpyruvate carboxykinase (ATP) [Chthoniobacterales bacterium]